MCLRCRILCAPPVFTIRHLISTSDIRVTVNVNNWVTISVDTDMTSTLHLMENVKTWLR